MAFSFLNNDSINISPKIASAVDEILNKIPLELFIGSNAWAVAPAKSKSGKVLLANDTHIGYGQPSVWYEAHINYPGYDFYGNHLAGFPFALVGHTNKYAWGLTMLENDDMDLYREKQNPENENQYWSTDHWENFIFRNETIKIKGAADSSFKVKITRHGPVINSVVENVGKYETDPVSVWWAFTNFSGTTFQATYELTHSKNMDDVRNACKLIEAPGLNVIYGDADGNIAWWACAKIMKRQLHVNSKIILDGANGKDEPLGFFDFAENPHAENPQCGFVYSANNLPDSVSQNIFPGYYAPVDRSERIFIFLSREQKFSAADMHELNSETVSDVQRDIAHEIIAVLKKNNLIAKSELNQSAAKFLSEWNGYHRLNDVAPVIHYKLFAHILNLAMKDEIGEEDFLPFQTTTTMKNAYKILFFNDSSAWWDNVNTKSKTETRKEIFAEAFSKTIDELQKQLGNDVTKWTWGKVHSTEFVHLIGRKKPMDKIFNVGPFPSLGGSETVNNAGFPLNTDGYYKSSYGPAMRIVIDFADI